MCSALVVGCVPSAQGYLRTGVGSELPIGNTEEVAVSQDEYFEYLCDQAGVQYWAQTPTGGGCPRPGINPEAWTLVVHQGMNDIDRRCDAYLEWLDDRKRSKGPLIAQVGAVQDTTNAILGFVVPGSQAIGIVAQAFGLITKSIENYHSRLILEVESSTVNALVLGRRHQFRKETANYAYSTRPAAEYALRSYLRICLPFAIETEINDFSTLSSKGAFNPNAESIHKSPAEVGIPGAQPTSARMQVFDPDRGSGTSNQETIRRINAAIQRAVCVADDGKKGEVTTEALRLYEIAEGSLPADGVLTENQENTLINIEPCPDGVENYYERQTIFNNQNANDNRDALVEALEELNNRFNVGLTITPDSDLKTLRDQISVIRTKMGEKHTYTGKLEVFNRQWTPDLDDPT